MPIQAKASPRRKLSNVAGVLHIRFLYSLPITKARPKCLKKNHYLACKEFFLRVQKLPTFHSIARALSVLRCDSTGHLQRCCWSVPTKLSFLFEVTPFWANFVWIKWDFWLINILLSSPLLKPPPQVMLTDTNYHLVMFLVLKDHDWYLIYRFVSLSLSLFYFFIFSN